MKNKVLIHRFTKTLRKIQARMEKITDGAIREATYIPVDLVEEDEYEDVDDLNLIMMYFFFNNIVIHNLSPFWPFLEGVTQICIK